MNEQPSNLTDHELILLLRQDVHALRAEVRGMTDDTRCKVDEAHRKVEQLEKEKLDKAEADKLAEEWKETTDQIWTRINWLSGIAFTGIGIIGTLEFYFQYLK